MTGEERRADAERQVETVLAGLSPLERSLAYLLLNADYGERMGEIAERIARLAREEAK